MLVMIDGYHIPHTNLVNDVKCVKILKDFHYISIYSSTIKQLIGCLEYSGFMILRLGH